jgi:hypothetical protein
MNISSEILLTLVTAAGGVLTGAVAKMWLFFHAELSMCQNDRKELHKKAEEMHAEIKAISTQVGRLEGRMERDS